MNFNNNKAIYEQMADRLCDEIIAENYKADDRIPSVREYAIMLEVNTNTAVKAYELLAREEIIYNKRGLGYFVAPDARPDTGTTQERVCERAVAGSVQADVVARNKHKRHRKDVERTTHSVENA